MAGKKEKIVVGLSGGVDSAVAAFLLQKEGYDVHAVFMKTFADPKGCGVNCPWRDDRREAYRVAKFLGIPIQTWDFQKEYHDAVLTYLFDEYRRGRTPNPDIMCNREIKFGVFLDRACGAGFANIATGHYARIRTDAKNVCHLLKGVDTNKDQSYFLAALKQSQLKHVLFPLGSMTKPHVRALAKKIKLPNALRPDSQGICFVGPVSMTAFLKTRIKPKQGDIVDTKGRVLGQHEGVYYYTIGQRRGIKVGGGPARYVIDKDIKRNRLIVGTENALQLFKKELTARQWHWVGEKFPTSFNCSVKVRYRQDDQRARLMSKKNGLMEIKFSSRQRGIAPGQIAVAYKGQELIGSGTIA